MESQNKFCQSCGMPMKKDPKNGGTNVDGTQKQIVLQLLLPERNIHVQRDSRRNAGIL